MTSSSDGYHPSPYSPDRPGLVRPVALDPTGRTGPTRAEVRRGLWRRSSHGLYVPAWLDAADPQQRVLEAAAMLPEYAMVTGWGALAWAGARWFQGIGAQGELLPVPLAVPNHRIRQRPGVLVCAERFLPEERCVHDGLAVTGPARTVLFEMRRARDVREAVKILDMAAYDDLVSIEEVAAEAAHLNGWTGIGVAREALPLADENAWSPMEVEMRLLLTLDLGIGGLLVNRPVFDRAGRHVATPDLLDPEASVAYEYDGELHLAGERRAADLRRETRLREVGLEVVTMLAVHRRDPTDFVRAVLLARRRGLQPGSSRRSWSLTPPVGWVVTTTVERRRALTPRERRRFLAYRDRGRQAA